MMRGYLFSVIKTSKIEEIRSKIDSPIDQILIGILKAFRVDLPKNKTVNILLIWITIIKNKYISYT